MNKIFDFLKNLKHIKKIQILPYHNYAASKYDALSLNKTLPRIIPCEEEINRLQTEADKIALNAYVH